MRTSLSLAVVGLLLMGAGCGFGGSSQANVNTGAGANANRPPANVNARGNVNAAANANINVNVNAPAPSGVRELPAATGVDATWETYTNDAIGFTFQAPTRGRYAPTWEVTFLAEGDARIQDGCFVDAQNESRTADRFSVDGVIFCRTFAREGAAGSVYLTQHVITKMGPRYVHLAFTKRAVNAAVLECATPPESGLSVSGDACIPFVMADFDAQIENIIATFRLVENP